MKKFSRCILVLLLVTVISAIGGYIYEDKTIASMYQSKTQLYVVPGEENEASVRAKNGGLNNDFKIIFKSSVVISEAQKQLGTSEDIAQYLSVSSPENSNIVEIICTNPDQNTAKKYVDAIALTALKTTNIIPVKSIQILSVGTSDNKAVKPDLYHNTIMITGIAAGICLVLELIIVLLIGAFKTPKDNSDDELEYEKNYGKYALYNRQTLPSGYIEASSLDLGPAGANNQEKYSKDTSVEKADGKENQPDNKGKGNEGAKAAPKLDAEDKISNKSTHSRKIRIDKNPDIKSYDNSSDNSTNESEDPYDNEYAFDSEDFDPLEDDTDDILEDALADCNEDEQSNDVDSFVVADVKQMMDENVIDAEDAFSDPMQDAAISQVDISDQLSERSQTSEIQSEIQSESQNDVESELVTNVEEIDMIEDSESFVPTKKSSSRILGRIRR